MGIEDTREPRETTECTECEDGWVYDRDDAGIWCVVGKCLRCNGTHYLDPATERENDREGKSDR
jgi:hypothetical protein